MYLFLFCCCLCCYELNSVRRAFHVSSDRNVNSFNNHSSMTVNTISSVYSNPFAPSPLTQRLSFVFACIRFYSGLALILMYIYQFNDVAEACHDKFDPITLREFGFQQHSGWSLLNYLVGPTVIFLSSVLQSRLFSRRRRLLAELHHEWEHLQSHSAAGGHSEYTHDIRSPLATAIPINQTRTSFSSSFQFSSSPLLSLSHSHKLSLSGSTRFGSLSQSQGMDFTSYYSNNNNNSSNSSSNYNTYSYNNNSFPATTATTSTVMGTAGVHSQQSLLSRYIWLLQAGHHSAWLAYFTHVSQVSQVSQVPQVSQIQQQIPQSSNYSSTFVPVMKITHDSIWYQAWPMKTSRFLKRLLVLVVPRLAELSLFLTLIFALNGLSFISMILLLLHVSSKKFRVYGAMFLLVWCQAVFIGSFIFHTGIIDVSSLCFRGESSNNGTTGCVSQPTGSSDAEWIGIDENSSDPSNFQGYIYSILLLAFSALTSRWNKDMHLEQVKLFGTSALYGKEVDSASRSRDGNSNLNRVTVDSENTLPLFLHAELLTVAEKTGNSHSSPVSASASASTTASVSTTSTANTTTKATPKNTTTPATTTPTPAATSPYNHVFLLPTLKEQVFSILNNTPSVICYDICLVLCVVTAFIRLNVVGLIYYIFLCIFLLMTKKSMSRLLWKVFIFVVTLSILIQFASLVDFPPSFEISYFWTTYTKFWEQGLVFWLYLPPHQYEFELIGNFLVFNRERKQ